jgi:hypothetical protein
VTLLSFHLQVPCVEQKGQGALTVRHGLDPEHAQAVVVASSSSPRTGRDLHR